MFLSEILRELLSIELVKMFPCIGKLVCAANHQRVVGVVDYTFELWHCLRVNNRSHMVANKQELSLGVIYDVMNLFCIKLMQYRNCYGTISESSEERHSPLA